MAGHKTGAIGRDYAAEYAARKQSGLARGLSVKQARGHTGQPRSAEGTVLGLRAGGLIGGASREQAMTAKKYAAVRRMAGGESLTRSAKEEGIAPSTLRKFIKDRRIAAPQYGKSRGGKPARIRRYGLVSGITAPILASDETFIPAANVDRMTASLLGHYWRDAYDGVSVARYANTVVFTLDGQSHQLMADDDAVRAFFLEMTPAEVDEFWRGFESP
jgi:hypothetical protein